MKMFFFSAKYQANGWLSWKIPRSVWEDLAATNDLDLNQSVRKGHNRIGLEILIATDTKSLKIGPETADPRSVSDDLAATSDLDLNYSVRKGHNQIGLKILSAIDTKSVKKGPEMTDLAQFSTLSQASPWFG